MSGADLTQMREGWRLCKLGDVVEESQNGLSKRRSKTGNPIHVLRLADIKCGSIDESSPRDILLDEKEIKKYLLKETDLLCIRVNGSRSLTGRMIQYRSKDAWAYCDHFIRFRVNQKVTDVKYISHYFDTQIARAYLDKKMVSTAGQNTVSQSTMYGVPIPIAPLEQQKRIVAKIEELFSHIDAGIEALKKAKQLLKQYRQSILKAAVTGELTKEWREANKDNFEPASKLLERILKERRQKWEEQQLEQFKAKGKIPKGDKWREKYKEPVSIETVPFGIPEEWIWISLDNLLFGIEAGKSFKCDERPPNDGETGIVKVSAVTWGEFDSSESKTIVDESKINPNYRIHEGDFLFSRANTIELVGACVIVKHIDKDLLLSDKILRFAVSVQPILP